jgi:flavin-dependent dehydrogenase
MLGLLTITVVVFGLTTAVATDEYDYVIIGSGPGGGSLTSVLTSYTQDEIDTNEKQRQPGDRGVFGIPDRSWR